MEPNYSQEDEIIRLLKKHLTKVPLTATEQLRLQHWLDSHPGNQAFADSLDRSLNGQDKMGQERIAEREKPVKLPTEWLLKEWKNYLQFDQEGIWNKTLQHRSPEGLPSSKMEENITPYLEARSKTRALSGKYWAAAAVLLIIAGAGLIHYFRTGIPAPEMVTVAKSLDLAPGRDGAILTLADGREIVLDSLGNGEIAHEGGTSIILKNGGLLYEGASLNNASAFNSIRTPKGRQFQLLLPDGSKVWLNAASSLRYPTSFQKDERKVEVSGEAYFEISPMANMPFIVKVGEKAQVTVLGTDFNINSYTDERAFSTSLFSGSVLVSVGSDDAGKKRPLNGSVVLKPGQQAQIANELAGAPPAEVTIKVNQNIDEEKVLAWKNGLFNFEGADLGEVMRQLERWYDIKVVYQKGIPDIYFEGKIGRDLSLASVLEILEGAEVHFRLEERRRLVVLP